MAYTLVGRSVAFLVALEGIKRAEFLDPWRAVQEAGGTPKLIAQSQDLLRAFDHQDEQVTMQVDEGVHDTSAAHYDGLVLTGGGIDTDTLHQDPHALRLVKQFFDAGKPVAAIGESVRTLAEAGVVSGRQVSCRSALQDHLRQRGAECVDERVAVHNGVVTSSTIEDVPVFCQKLVEEFGRVASLATG